MKKLIWIIILVLVFFVGYQNRGAFASAIEQLAYYAPCKAPRTYRIGSIDPRFNITQTEFLAATKEAGRIWKNNDAQPLFVYDPESKLTINMVYDERQYLNNQVDELNNKVEVQKNTLKPEIASYEKRAADFKRRSADLNARVDYWNNKGGAPEDEYNKLIQEQKSLQQEAQILNTMAENLNQSTDQYNTQIQELDQRVDAYNTTLQAKPEEGEYIRNAREEKIVLYFNNSHAELIHTLAHEMGHALGVAHNNNSLSIMYPKTTLITTLSNSDIASLVEVCRKRSLIELTRDKYALLIEAVKSKTQSIISHEKN